MRNAFYVLAWSVALSALAVAARAEPPGERTVGKVLVLDSERTLEGDIERVGSQYRVRRTVGETWIPGERVLQLCPDVAAAYGFLRGRANLNDADERLRLAEWCREHGLREQALAEVREAVRLRPNHASTRRLLAHLQQEPLPAPAKPAGPVPEATAPQVDLTADCLGMFATRVQPILMNTCAGCHASDKGGKFRLTRCYESESANHKVVQQNLAAVLAQVNLREPRVSPLLTKAVSVHGPLAQAPLKSRQAPAYRTLEEWVRLTLANNPVLQEPPATPPVEAKAPAAGKSEEAFAGDNSPKGDPTPTPAAAAAAPTTKPAPPDPFDPSVFNRRSHPEKDSPPAPKP